MHEGSLLVVAEESGRVVFAYIKEGEEGDMTDVEYEVEGMDCCTGSGVMQGGVIGELRDER